jgi:hypothetical protein
MTETADFTATVGTITRKAPSSSENGGLIWLLPAVGRVGDLFFGGIVSRFEGLGGRHAGFRSCLRSPEERLASFFEHIFRHGTCLFHSGPAKQLLSPLVRFSWRTRFQEAPPACVLYFLPVEH